MPIVSKDQNAAMHAAAEGHSTLGIPKSVGAEYVAAGLKTGYSKLPQKVSKKKHQAAAAPDHTSASPHTTDLGNQF